LARAQAPADEPTGWVPRSGGRARCRRFRPRADQDDGIRPGGCSKRFQVHRQHGPADRAAGRKPWS